MILRTLQYTSIEELTITFNEAFKNYFVEINFTPEQLLKKFKVDGVKLDLSVGAFDGEKLVGFIFHGTDDLKNYTAYNAGTGVIKEYRGQHIPKQLYKYNIPILKNAKISKIKLEAITENNRAIGIYKNLGFTILRKVDCYKGTLDLQNKESKYPVTIIEEVGKEVSEWWDVHPTWQNANHTVIKYEEEIIKLGVSVDEKIIAYLLFNALSGRIFQFGVKKEFRRQGMATALFKKAADIKKELTLINVDSRSEEIAQFLNSIGFELTLSQYEMELGL